MVAERMMWHLAQRSALAVLLALTAAIGAALAQAPARTPEQIMAALPLDIPEVHTGGSWQEGPAQGVYRAAVVLAPGDSTARVYVQWIAMKPDNPVPELVKSVAIKEIADKKLPNAFLTLDVEKEGEVTIIVASFDPATNKDQVLAFKATKPGSYAPTAVPAGGTGSGSAVPPGKQ